MHPNLYTRPKVYHARQHILCRQQEVRCPDVRGPIVGLYPLPEQCRLTHSGASPDPNEPGHTLHTYLVLMPLMLLGQRDAGRVQLPMTIALSTPFDEQTQRARCSLQLDCDVLPRSAQPNGEDGYRITFDAKIALYATVAPS